MKVILVTGAAGTIGSAVVKELVDIGHIVIAVDNAETPLFDLGRGDSTRRIVKYLCDIRDPESLAKIADRCSVQAIVHAAAYKHVGMCESNPREAILNNIGGTISVRAVAEQRKCRLVLVSTDKAVEPTTKMGATKAVAEAVVLNYELGVVVRLVNIVGSTGSLLPLLDWHAANGEPFYLRGDMKRYFMEASEAAKIIAMAVDRVENGRVAVPNNPMLIDIGSFARGYLHAKAVVALSKADPEVGEKLIEKIVWDYEKSIPGEYSAQYYCVVDGGRPSQASILEVVNYVREVRSLDMGGNGIVEFAWGLRRR